MKRRTKLLIATLAAALVLMIALSPLAFADEPAANAGPVRGLIGRVAVILGLPEQQVADAFKQAKQEMRDEALDQRLQKAVDSGRLTAAEAEEIQAWLEARPEALDRFPLLNRAALNKLVRQKLARPGVRQFLKSAPALAQVFDERLSGTVASVSDGAITLTLKDGTLATFAYTAKTVFAIRGATGVEVGQKVVAWCWEDAQGNLTAKFVSGTLQ